MFKKTLNIFATKFNSPLQNMFPRKWQKCSQLKTSSRKLDKLPTMGQDRVRKSELLSEHLN